MRLYNIEAIKDDKFKLFELYNNDNFLNDTLFLRDFFRTLSNIHERGIGSATAYFKAFYEYYINQGGDARYWLEKTIENVVYPDVILETWLDVELKTASTKPKPTPVEFLEQNQDKLKNRGNKSIKSVMEEIAANSPYSYSYLERIRKEMNLTYI